VLLLHHVPLRRGVERIIVTAMELLAMRGFEPQLTQAQA
jgi:hypothetical protein